MGVVTSGSCIQTLKEVKPPEGPQEAGLFCRSFLEKGEVFAYGGSIQTLKDLIIGRRDLRFP